MSHNFSKHLDRVKQWSATAQRQGWLSSGAVQALEQIEQQQVEQLFADGSQQRPLIVALFGGTGVGKSSLLNRLAGAPVASAGIERPTSHHVTLYIHQDYHLNVEATGLPVEQIHVRHHQDDSRRLIAWLDLPDIDSTEQRNRELVLEWLPYIDWLVYVVSPERYQDDSGWRLLQQRNQRHNWLFVMNHWDEAVNAQLNDLRARLIDAGFEKPTLLRTCCSDPSIADDFNQLETTINAALRQYGIEVLQQIGTKARLNDLRQQSEKLYQAMSPEALWRTLHQQWQQHVTQRCNGLQQLLHEQSTLLTQSLLASDTSNPLIGRSTAQIPLTQLSAAIQQLWLPRFDTWLKDTCIELQNQLQQHGLRSAPFRAPLEKFIAHSAAQCTETVIAELMRSTAKPGNTLQRGAYRLSGWLCGILPLAAASWAAYHLISAFNSGISGDSLFLGANFAIHSLLLIAIAWLIPWLLHRQLKPSLSAAARKGLANGTEAASENLKNALEEVWSEVSAERQTLITELDEITKRIP